MAERGQVSPSLSLDEFPDVQPKMPLPWASDGREWGEVHREGDRGDGVAYDINFVEDAAYIVAACNAYPKLRSALAALLQERDEARRLATEYRDGIKSCGQTDCGLHRLPWETLPAASQGDRT